MLSRSCSTGEQPFAGGWLRLGISANVRREILGPCSVGGKGEFMNFIRAFTSFSGRIGRRGFWAGIITIFVLGSLAKVSTTPDILSSDPFSALSRNWRNMGAMDVLIYLAMLYPAMALVTQRLHDRNKSGLYAALFWGPALVQAANVFLPGISAYLSDIMWGWNLLAAWIGAVGIWFFVELGFYGPREPNKYGPDPRND